MMSKILCILVLAVVAVICQQVPTPGLPSIPSNFNIQDYLGTGPIPPTGRPDVVGAFRFICNAAHLAYDDPIVYPGQPGASHLHQFYGNTLANAHSTYESLRTTGNSTCQNILNRSSYWMPAMLNGKGGVVRPNYISIYYKRRPKTDPYCQVQGIQCVDTPRGLRMLFGYDLGASVRGNGYFNCDGPTARSDHYPDIVTAAKNCPNGNSLGAIIGTPDCWDGKNLDSPNHRDHMAFGSYGWWGYYKCPETHPYVIPGFSLGAWYTVDSDLDKSGNWNPSIPTWHLSSDVYDNGTMVTPGLTFHADWFGAWDDTVMKTWHDNCIDKLLNCAAGELGDGTGMKMYDGFSWAASPRVVPVPARYTAKFNSLEASSTLLAGYTQNDFIRMKDANSAFSNGVLSLTLNTDGCPQGCGGKNYASGGWRKNTPFEFGSYTFSAQGTTQSGSVLAMAIVNWDKGSAIRVQLPGSQTNKIQIDTFTNSTHNPFGQFTLPFNHATAYNKYTVVRALGSLKVLANGVQIFSTSDASKVPSGPLNIELSYEAHPSWWGTFSYTAPSIAKFNAVVFV